ncbi:MAG: hypothetical protein K6E35_04750 [Bacteroidales bacterium]|nr:hypothetical protein [Bacteroidales bacterium]
MRKNLLAGMILILLSAVVSAQEPTTKWPYLFPEFRSGVVELAEGTSRTYQLNMHLRHGQLHFLDTDGVIRETPIDEVLAAKVGQDRFLQVQGEMMRVVAQSEHGCVVEEVLGDFAALQETGGAYGASSQTSATRRLSSIYTDGQINQNHVILMQSRSDGKMLDLIKTYYFVYPGHVLNASRSGVESSIPADRLPDWKAWGKSHKVKWNRPESMLSVLEFLNP